MQIKVLVVDDSKFYRNRLREILTTNQDILVVGTAENGREAVEKALSLKPDVITMDIEMPVMDGIAAVREIMKKRPTPVLMLSSLTTDGAQATLDALEAGAVDFLLKRLDKLSYKYSEFAGSICNKIIALGKRSAIIANQSLSRNDVARRHVLNSSHDRQVYKATHRHDSYTGEYKVVVIGASTGGPVAVQSIVSALPGDFSIPILIVQHMPAAFTTPFAHRLDTLSKLAVKEAEDGDILSAGRVYVAPGGKQMCLELNAAKAVVRIRQSSQNDVYKPSVDITYKSVSEAYGDAALAIILTGMGSDGRDGAMQLKKGGSVVWAQDEGTSVVYGMPQAVIDAGLADRVLPLTEMAHQLAVGL